jgi:uncharacterized protein with von Willebrand factor type A (vWA) domain
VTSVATGGALFVGVDRALFAAALAARLRLAGVGATIPAVERCAAALEAVGPLTVDDLYWSCRISFVAERAELAAFDRVFGEVFGADPGRLPARTRGQRRDDALAGDHPLQRLPRSGDAAPAPGAALPWATLPSVVAAESDDRRADDDDDAVLPLRRPSALAVDVDRPFDVLDEDELRRVGELLEAAVTSWPQRRSRRRRTTRSRGPIALRRSVRSAMDTGGDVVRLVHTEQRRQPRRVVVLLDVSGSMESYARAYLHLTRGLAITHHAEVFAFATRLSRITASVRQRSPAEAIEQVSNAVGDRFSGTLLATSLTTLLHHRVWNGTVRGAVVVVCSDGWDADDPVRLERAMRRLSLLAHRVVWVNPRAAAPGFEPLAGGMAAALPFCDHFLAGNTARSMGDVVAAITAA